jgi:hypothetical protein
MIPTWNVLGDSDELHELSQLNIYENFSLPASPALLRLTNRASISDTSSPCKPCSIHGCAFFSIKEGKKLLRREDILMFLYGHII